MTNTVHEREADTFFVTDEELYGKLNVPEKIARAAIHALDCNPRSGFPKKQKLWGDRRYLPAVRAYFDLQYGIINDGAARLIPENRTPHPAAASSSNVRTLPRRGT